MIIVYFILIFLSIVINNFCTDYDLAQLIHNGRLCSVLFVPDDNVEEILLQLISYEKQSIDIAQFRLTNNKIVQALLDAYFQRNVRIRIISDVSCLKEPREKLSILNSYEIPIHIYHDARSIMHNKFFIFGNNIENKCIAWSGSSNATISGVLRNQENVFITNEQALVDRYSNKFNKLWRETHSYKNNFYNLEGVKNEIHVFMLARREELY